MLVPGLLQYRSEYTQFQQIWPMLCQKSTSNQGLFAHSLMESRVSNHSELNRPNGGVLEHEAVLSIGNLLS